MIESYGAILCDPPWNFKTHSPRGRDRSPDKHYDCMLPAAMKRLMIPAAKDCALFMWVVDAHLIEAPVGGPYLEMFSRTNRAGWDAVGDETGKFG